MSDATHHAHAHHGPKHYVKIWAILMGLLVVSVLGPLLEIRVITLITAFGVAIVKAGMVVYFFMHINVEKKYVAYMVGSMVVLMALMVGAVTPDVMHHTGANWQNVAAQDEVKRGLAKGDKAEHHGGEHGA